LGTIKKLKTSIYCAIAKYKLKKKASKSVDLLAFFLNFRTITKFISYLI
jgi:hypothetical protein